MSSRVLALVLAAAAGVACDAVGTPVYASCRSDDNYEA